MKRPGMLRTISIVGGILLATPMAILGVELIARERPLLGVAFLGLAVVALVLPEYIIYRIPGPRTVVRRRLERFRKDE